MAIANLNFRIKMRLSVIEASDRLVDLINPDKPEVFEIEDPLMGPKVSYSKSPKFFWLQAIRELSL